MTAAEFDYSLPPEAIAQQPAEPRDAARLMVLGSGAPSAAHFRDLPDCLERDDLLVLNDTRVFPARLIGEKESGGRCELLLLEREANDVWQAWLRGSRKPAPGATLTFGDGLSATVLSREDRVWRLRFRSDDGPVDARLETQGRIPLPPYIERPGGLDRSDRERYQTVYARRSGAVAAPTAGLHFTPELLARLDRSGVQRTALTLHVGPGTFRPVQVERLQDHVMHEERFELPAVTVEAIRDCRERGGRVVAVGTTVVRVLESCAAAGELQPTQGRTALFIKPGHRFSVVDVLITNFHLPRSTLLMLVCAFGGHRRILDAYRTAIEAGYRFYSYGDAMWVEPA